jgi:hypothetical protein
MRMTLIGAMVGALLFAVPTTASAAKRFAGCVAESRGCTHQFSGGSLPVIQFKDRRRDSTPYRLCVRDPVHRVCARRTTGRAGKWHRGATWNIGAVGKHVATWFVGGKRVARWRFRVGPEND